MPEGHLLHRAAREHTALLGGRTVRASSPQGRFADGAAALDGHTLERVSAHGKHVLYRFDTTTVHVHLGLRGFWLVSAGPPLPDPRPGVRLRLATDTAAVDLIAAMACELYDDDAVARLLAKLGPDPLDDGADPAAAEDEAVRRLRAARGPLAAVLLDQAVWSGLGNAFRAELLYLMRLSPTTPAAALDDGAARRLWRLAREQMTVGVARGTIATVDGETDAKWVYKREHCRGCGTPVATAEIAARTTYWCPAEQR